MVALLACMSFASCSQDELTEEGRPLPVGQYPLELVAGGLQAVATPAQTATRGTMDGDWDGVTSVTVWVNDKWGKKYNVEASGAKKTARLTPASPLGNDDKFFWWTSVTEQKIVMATNAGLYRDIYLPTEWTEKDFDQFDVIAARRTISFEEDKYLEFKHLMTKVVINLRETEYLKKAKDVKVQLMNMLDGGRLDFDSKQTYIDGTHTGGIISKDVNMTPYRLPAGAYEDVDFGNGQREKPFASYMALAIPRNIGDTNVLQIEVDGAKYILTTSAITSENSVNYIAGQATIFNVTVKESGLGVTVGNMINWGTNGATGSGEMELP